MGLTKVAERIKGAGEAAEHVTFGKTDVVEEHISCPVEDEPVDEGSGLLAATNEATDELTVILSQPEHILRDVSRRIPQKRMDLPRA
jgi:hypothetical protein